MSRTRSISAAQAAAEYQDLSQKLSLQPSHHEEQAQEGVAVQARFITPLDPVIETATGDRLPAVPLEEAHKINALKEKAEGIQDAQPESVEDKTQEKSRAKVHRSSNDNTGDRLNISLPPLQTHPLFPPLPLYGPPTILRNAQYFLFQTTSFCLSTAFLAVIVLGAIFTAIPGLIDRTWLRLTLRDPNKKRPFHVEEKRRAADRKSKAINWQSKFRRNRKGVLSTRSETQSPPPELYTPLEGGPDRLVCDARYYARRAGIEMEIVKVQTEDGFILDLWHLYDPVERASSSRSKERGDRQASEKQEHQHNSDQPGRKRYPVLLIHGLLQSAGAYCCNDEDSLAFYLHKSGYDVWLGNNRCGFNPQHSLLKYSDPRLWAWNIRQMGVMDLPAFVSKVLEETGFSKLGLVAHSQGTTQTFVALAKEQRPDLGEKISVFCALAPAVFAGPLIEKMYFKFMRVISPAMFRIFFGIHAFIPLMMTMHRILPAKLYGMMGYLVFSFLFDWTDVRWDRGLRDRAFQFAPVYVSSESMRWWLGRECFAKHKCVLSTHEDDVQHNRDNRKEKSHSEDEQELKTGQGSWYDKRCPPVALWIAGSDNLVDGRRLLDRFEQGREPHTKLVHSKVIEDYEHLDVLWAMDSIDKVGSEVRAVIWQTVSDEDKAHCRSVQVNTTSLVKR